MKHRTTSILALLVPVAFLDLQQASGQVWVRDCPEAKFFHTTVPQLSKDQCLEKGQSNGEFFASDALRNPAKKQKDWMKLPVCLGFGSDIDRYFDKGGRCRRLSAEAWSLELNQQFLQCIADGYLGDAKPIWTTAMSGLKKEPEMNELKNLWNVPKNSKDWTELVTVSEMCYWKGRTGEWPVYQDQPAQAWKN